MRSLFFCNGPASTEIYTLSLHDALPISMNTASAVRTDSGRSVEKLSRPSRRFVAMTSPSPGRSEEHTSELQSRFDLVCRLLLEKKNQSCPQPPPRPSGHSGRSLPTPTRG